MMRAYEAFGQPAYLLLLLLIPLIWWISRRALSGLGPLRGTMAIAIRVMVLLLLVAALAELEWRETSDRITVMYLLDQSASIPPLQRQRMLDYVVSDVSRNRDAERRDRAGVIVFGREASMEVPPVDEDLPLAGQFDSLLMLRDDATNLEGALKLAQASFPEGSARRVVLVTDGNETLGNASAIAQHLTSNGVGLDVVAIPSQANAEVTMERVHLPSDIRKGQPFEARIVLQTSQPNTQVAAEPAANRPTAARGTLRITRRMGESVETLDQRTVELPSGKSVFRVQDELALPDFYEYEATFVPEDSQSDSIARNNRATSFVQVLGHGHVLLIEDWENPGEFDYLVERLRQQDIQVTVQRSNQLFSSLGELQRYDTVILANVPRSSGDTATGFSESQIRMLVENTNTLGCGLLMLGGPNSFGAGGWTNTELEKAMPVDFQIQNAKVNPVGALAMVMHASEMAQGNHWQKVIAEEALKSLGPHDYCGIIHWGRQEEWLWGAPEGLVRVGPHRSRMLSQLSRMTPGDMPDFNPSLQLAAAAFAKTNDAAVKHMIIISDGDPTPPTPAVLRSLRDLEVRISTVAVGTHGPPTSTPLQRIADYTGGKFYVVNNPNALPRIYQREARRVSRPLVKEGTFVPQIISRGEILQGIEANPPAVGGFVLTQLKQSPLVEIGLQSPDPPQRENATILASWQHGAGRTAVLTTDAGRRWANAWTEWPGYDKLFTQLVRWSMRPTGDTGNSTLAVDIQDERIRVVLTAMDAENQLLSLPLVTASVLTPSMKSSPLAIRQVAPGRYEGEFPADDAGSYFITVAPGNQTPLRTGITVPYAAEFRLREWNQGLLDALANMQPAGGEAGRLTLGPLEPNRFDEILSANPYRAGLPLAVSARQLWPSILVLASSLFFADVLIRRVAFDFGWLRRFIRSFFRRSATVPPPSDERLQRLKARKTDVAERIDQRRAAARFEPTSDDLTGPPGERPIEMPIPPPATTEKGGLAPEESTGEDQSYTSRLLKAKQQMWKDRNNP